MEEKNQNDETKSVIEVAKELKEQIKAENDRREEILAREEALEARRMLGGRSEAGQEQKKKSEEEIKKDGALEFFKGSEIEHALRKHG